MTNGYCVDTLIFGLVENSEAPPLDCRELNGISWQSIKEGWTKKLKVTLFQPKDEDTHHKNFHIDHVPNKDPCFSHTTKIHSVPTAWVTDGLTSNSRLGINLKYKIDRATGEKCAEVLSKTNLSKSKLIVGDIIVKIANTVIASDDGVLLPQYRDKEHLITNLFINASKDKIVVMGVLWVTAAEQITKCKRRKERNGSDPGM